MSKVTLNKEMFKALASDTRLDILRTLDGKKLGLKEISEATKLNKATLHEHLTKLNEAGLVKRNERAGHKWVYYRLSWKGASLLHPENTRIVVMFALTFATLLFGLFGIFNYLKEYMLFERGSDLFYSPDKEQLNDTLVTLSEKSFYLNQNPIIPYMAISCLILFFVLMIFTVWRYKNNKTPKL